MANVHESEKSAVAPGSVLLLTTEQRVYGFDLAETFRVAIGRHESNDLHFDSRNVSNYHAEILNEGTGLILRDLGSTNGTFLNEERVRERKLCPGDRVRIGRYEVGVKLSSPPTKSGASTPTLTRDGKLRAPGEDAAGTGGAITLKQLLLKLADSDQSFRLVLSRDQGEDIVVFIHGGRVIHAEAGSARDEKALYRAFEWRQGSYRVEVFPANQSVPRAMALPVETIVEEGERQAAELVELIGKLPPPDAPLRLREDCKMRICEFSPAEIEVFQTLVRHGSLGRSIEASNLTDLRVMSLTHTLIRKKVFAVDEDSGLLEQTAIITRV